MRTANAVSQALSLAWSTGRASLLVYAALTLVGAAVPVSVAWFTKLVIDDLTTEADAIVGLAVALALVGLFAAMVPEYARYLRADMDRRVGRETQNRLYYAVERFQGLGRFEDPAFHDRLRLAEHAARLTPNRVVDGTLGGARGGLVLAGFIGSLAILSPVMTATLVVAVVPSILAELALSRRRAQMFMEISPAERKEMFYARLLGTVEAAKEIRLFATGGFLRGRMLSERRRSDRAKRHMDRRELVVQSGLGALGAVVAGGGLVWAILAAGRGALTVGDVAMFVAAVAGMQSGATAVVNEIAAAHNALLLFEHYLAVVRAEPDLVRPERYGAIEATPYGISLRDVWFRYADDHPFVLRGVNLTIPWGTSVALVGRNGSGKSTLVKLLCRFYDPTHGAIRWGDVDLRDIRPEDLRSRIGAVFQDFMCYDLTAEENIALGDLSSLGDRERLERVAQLAGVHEDLVDLPRGYQTLLSRMFSSEADKADPSTGVILSGGQWQRLALARGFLRGGADLMILDEPSAVLDAEAEHQIHVRLAAHRAGRTSLLISHRLSAVREADIIVVLDDGVVAEQGSHDELLAADGLYARLFSLQAAGYQPIGRPGP